MLKKSKQQNTYYNLRSRKLRAYFMHYRTYTTSLYSTKKIEVMLNMAPLYKKGC